jgi:hypothetical protein
MDFKAGTEAKRLGLLAVIVERQNEVNRKQLKNSIAFSDDSYFNLA